MTQGQWSANGHNTIVICCSKEILYIDHSFSLLQGLRGYKCSEHSPESVRTPKQIATPSHHNNSDTCNNSTCQPSGASMSLQWASARGCRFDWWCRTSHLRFFLVRIGQICGCKTSGRIGTELMFGGLRRGDVNVPRTCTLLDSTFRMLLLRWECERLLTCGHGCGTRQTWHSAFLYGQLAHVHPPSTVTHP